ncbi:MAG: ABC transporter permease [Actinobacteria bacterium]|nr:ABC transporter permease [Actinomycetota bacterium]
MPELDLAPGAASVGAPRAEALEIAPEETQRPARLPAARGFVNGVLGTTTGRVGLVMVLVVVLIAVFGPLVRPHDPSVVVGAPYGPSSGTALLGTEALGRDGLSRFLSGGRLLLLVGLATTTVAYLIGGALGLMMGYARGVFDAAASTVVDIFLSVPPIILALLLVAGLGSGVEIVALAVTAVQIPPIARLVRSFTLAVAATEYVEAAVARGERQGSILWHEVLPNIRIPILADIGIRMSWSIMLFASLSFLGFGQSPPAADWGLMISENRGGLLIQPLPVLVPAVAIAVLAIGTNLVSDAFGRSIGRTQEGSHASR